MAYSLTLVNFYVGTKAITLQNLNKKKLKCSHFETTNTYSLNHIHFYINMNQHICIFYQIYKILIRKNKM